MLKTALKGFLFIKLILVFGKEADLPLCPTNVLYFPQNLPMHCRMPTGANIPGLPGPMPIPTVPPFYQNLPADKQPMPISIPVPPAMPGPMPLPGPMPPPGTMPFQGPMPPLSPIPFPGPMPMPFPAPGPAQKLPVIVMPFYSPDTSFKRNVKPNIPQRPIRPRKRRIRHRRRKPYLSSDTSSSTDTDTSSDTSSSEDRGWWKDKRNSRRSNRLEKIHKRRHNQRRELLTPVLQYVTKDGYVVFEKHITKNEAKDWLSIKKEGTTEKNTRKLQEIEDMGSNEPDENFWKIKETVTEDNVEVLTQRNPRWLRIKEHKKKAKKKLHKD